MIERIAELVNADERLVWRGRFVHTTFLIEIGDAGYLVRIADGRVVAVTPGPFVTPNYSFALRAPPDAWQTFWQQRLLEVARARGYTLARGSRLLASACTGWRRRWQGEVLSDRDFDDARTIYRQCLDDGVSNLVRP